MQLKNIDYNQENFSKGGPIIATETAPAYEYKDGQRQDKIIGLKVSVVFPGNHYDTLTVTISDTVDRLSAAIAKGNPVPVTFQNFTARVYVIDGRPGVSAKADAVHIVTDDDDLIIA